MRRSLLVSCALHGVIVLIVLATSPRRDTRESASAVEIAFDAAPAPIPPLAVDVDRLTHTGGGGPVHPIQPAVESARAYRRRPLAIRAAVADRPSTPEPPGLAPPPATEESLVEVAPGAPAPGPTGEPAVPAAGNGDGTGAGNGLGDGFGDGFGLGAGGPAMRRELHARVLGNEAVNVRPREGSPTISHDEATALRTHDSFPRLPESVWAEWRPYIVKLEICVAEDGRVGEAVLRSSASTRLDPIVLAAAKTWRYRPRLVDGKPAPFCHGVVIKYERW
jgi:outer membrane biosynthesis protein TonB